MNDIHEFGGAAGAESRRRAQSGGALIVAMVFFVAAAGLSVTMYLTVDSETTEVDLDFDRTQALAYAEGLSEVAENELVTRIATYRRLDEGTEDHPFRVLSGEEDGKDLRGEWFVERATVTQGPFDEPVALEPRNDVEADTGLRRIIDTFVVTSIGNFRGTRVAVKKRVEVRKMPLFQFLVFYDDDLEINPGPQMVLDGRVHANADIYLTSDGGVKIESKYFRTAGQFNRHRKDEMTARNGRIDIYSQSEEQLVELPDRGDLLANDIESLWGLDSNFEGWDVDGDGAFDGEGEMPPFAVAAMEFFGGTMQTGEHGVSSFAHPTIPNIQAYEEIAGGDWVQTPTGFSEVGAGAGTHSRGYFHQNAELVIVDDRVFDGSGNDITADLPAGFVKEIEMYDAREGGEFAMTLVDLSLLGDMDGDPATLDPSPHYPENGLVFAYRSDTEAGNPTGIVLTGGEELNVPQRWNSNLYVEGGILEGTEMPVGAFPFTELQETGLTVVSPAPVYVHGDFNTVNKKSSAVITDTVNLLSNSWDFGKTPGSLPDADDTTYNLAFVTGNHVTHLGDYNGGLENLPRFHEDWGGKDCRINGSFVNLWRSQMALGEWVYGGDRYKAPKRIWGFDHDFDTDLPPYTPMVVTSASIGWEVQG